MEIKSGNRNITTIKYKECQTPAQPKRERERERERERDRTQIRVNAVKDGGMGRNSSTVCQKVNCCNHDGK
jgi:hypothetical protein